jgi:DNA-binding winged helix-turn-helix (wHTH) protein
MRIEFGDCTLDSETREVSRASKALRLEPKAYRLLELLLESRPKALSKAALQDELWPKTFVSELALSRLVSVLRSALRDRGKNPRFIRTVHGFGYAFCGEAAEASRPARDRAGSEWRCRVVYGDRQIDLSEGENLIGRDPSAAVWIDLASVSRRHARILVDGGAATLEDLGSRNGTSLRGQRLSTPTRLSSGDRIRVGTTTLVFRSSRRLGTTEALSSQPVGQRRRLS